MRLSVYSLQSTIFDGEVESLTLPTPTGEITILDGHIPLISIVSPGQVCYTRQSIKESFEFPGGVLEVRPPNVGLAQSGVPKSEVVLLLQKEV